MTNPVSVILNDPMLQKISTLYTGMLSSSEINNQLTTSIPDLITLISFGFGSDTEYSSVWDALNSTAYQHGIVISIYPSA
jgi:hypothetical protein